MPVIWSRKSLPNYSSPEFYNSALLSFIIDFAWPDLFMTPASELSRLWYMVLLVRPTRSTVCWTKFSKSSMIKSTSSSGAVVALSRPCHTFDRGPMTSIFFFLIFRALCLRCRPMFDVFQKMGLKFVQFSSVILERTGFSGKIDYFKSHSCTYWLKWELAYFAMSSGRTHLNW